MKHKSKYKVDADPNMIIEFNNVNKTFDHKIIIKELSLKIPKYKFIAIMGPSGAGKTTLLNLASGLEKPDQGSIILNGYKLDQFKEPKLTRFRSKHIGYMFQSYNLIDYLNVKDNITVTQKLHHQKIDKAKLTSLIEAVGLAGFQNKSTAKLSGGQKQRVAIARALLGANEVIFGDEPTGALDLATRNAIIELLRDQSKQYHKSLILVTHDPQVAAYADQVIFLLNGHINAVSDQLSATEIANKLLALEQHAKN